MITNQSLVQPTARANDAVAYLLRRQQELARELREPVHPRQRRIGVSKMSREAAIGAALADLQHDIDALSAEALCRR